MNTFYDLLRQIQEKPGLYLGRPSVQDLYMFLSGYNFSRRQLNIPLSGQECDFQEFQAWLQRKFKMKTSQSWGHMIAFHTIDDRAGFDRFFELFEAFLKRNEYPADEAGEATTSILAVTESV